MVLSALVIGLTWPSSLNLVHQLEPGEQMEADNGCSGKAPECVVCPDSCTTREESLSVMKRVKGHHEAMNKHLKNWKCVKGSLDVKGPAVDRMHKHGTLFHACAIVKQMALQMGVGELHDL